MVPSEPQGEGRAGETRPRRVGRADSAGELPSLEDSLVLLERYQRDDDRAALDELLERYRPRLRRIVGIRLKARNEHRFDASDVVQATLMQVMRELRGLEIREDAKLVNWLAKVAERQLFDQLRASRAQKRDERREVELDAPATGGGAPLDPPAEVTDVPGRAAKAEMKEVVDACLAELPELYREVILLRDYAGGTWPLIAEELGRPSEDAARKAYERARKALLECVRKRTGGAENV